MKSKIISILLISLKIFSSECSEFAKGTSTKEFDRQISGSVVVPGRAIENELNFTMKSVIKHLEKLEEEMKSTYDDVFLPISQKIENQTIFLTFRTERAAFIARTRLCHLFPNLDFHDAKTLIISFNEKVLDEIIKHYLQNNIDQIIITSNCLTRFLYTRHIILTPELLYGNEGCDDLLIKVRIKNLHCFDSNPWASHNYDNFEVYLPFNFFINSDNTIKKNGDEINVKVKTTHNEIYILKLTIQGDWIDYVHELYLQQTYNHSEDSAYISLFNF